MKIKYILAAIVLICGIKPVFADSCIMISETSITDIKCKDCGIINVKPLLSLSNEKKSIMVTSLRDGQTELTIKIKNKSCCYKVTVSNGKLKICGDNKIKILPVDLPPEVLPQGDCIQ